MTMRDWRTLLLVLTGTAAVSFLVGVEQKMDTIDKATHQDRVRIMNLKP